ncbi:flotillin-like FloA family protein, partial [uncultured Megasphaera sp.]
EMQAYTQEMQAKVVEAQAEVPLALAQALREGKLGVMDYYNMKNIMADTKMRDAVAQAGVPKTKTVPTGAEQPRDERGNGDRPEK